MLTWMRGKKTIFNLTYPFVENLLHTSDIFNFTTSLYVMALYMLNAVS